MTSSDENEDGKLTRGSSIGRYVILNVEGRGGMGVVYPAYDPELDRCADLELLRSAVEPPRDDAMRARVAALRVRAATAKALNDTARHQEARRLGTALISEAREIGYEPLLAEVLGMVGGFEEGPEFRADSVSLLEEAVWKALTAHRDDVAAQAAAQLTGTVGYLMGRHSEGHVWAQLAHALLDRMGPGHELLRSWVLQNESNIKQQENDPAGALRLAREAVALRERILPAGDPGIAISLGAVSEAQHLMGDQEGALQTNQKAYEMFVRSYGPSSSDAAMNLSNRGEYLLAAGRAAEARAVLQEALARWEAQVGPGHAFLAYPLTGLGRALLALGRAPEAVPVLERALRLRETTEGDPGLLADTRFALAQALWNADVDRTRALSVGAKARSAAAQSLDNARIAEIAAWIDLRARKGDHRPDRAPAN